MDYVIDQIPVGMSMETRKGLKKFAYQLVTIADWACGAHDYRQLLSEHWTLALCAATFLLCFSLTLIHALRHGGRYIYLWQSTFFFGIIREISNVYLFPNANFCWHGQTLLTFFGRRIPAYVLFCLYPTFVYSSLVIVKRLKLGSPAECFLVALCSTVARIPYEILGTKLLWFTWHSDHPFVKQKLYHIPLSVVVLYFWSVACFVAFLHLSQRLLLPPLYNWKLFAREIACCWLAAICGPLVGYLLFENAFVLSHWLFSNGTIGVLAMSHLVCFYLLVFGYFARQPAKASAVSCVELNVAWLLQCVCFLIIAFAVRPEEIVSTGLHQPIGRCGTRIATPAMLLSGFEMERFMCPRLVESYEFDFHCTRAPSEHKPIEWYTICGKAFEKHAEFVLVLLWIMTAVTAAQVNWCWPFKNGGKTLSKDKDE